VRTTCQEAVASFPEGPCLEEPFRGVDTSFQEGPFQEEEEEEEAVLRKYQEASGETNAAAFQGVLAFQEASFQAVPFQEAPFLVELSFQAGPFLVEPSFQEEALFDHEAAVAVAVGLTWSTQYPLMISMIVFMWCCCELKKPCEVLTLSESISDSSDHNSHDVICEQCDSHNEIFSFSLTFSRTARTTMTPCLFSSLTALFFVATCSSFSPIPSNHAVHNSALHAAADRRSFLVGLGGVATASVLATMPAVAAVETVLVLGGTGLVGGEVVKKLKSMGVTVIATSRDGRDGTVAVDFTKLSNVATTIQELSKGCQAVISCVGAIGTEEDAVVNSATGLAAAGAAAAGVEHFVYISVAPEVRALAKNIDFLKKYMEGKSFSEDSIIAYFGKTGKTYTIIEPTFIFGGDDFKVNPPRVASAYGQLVETVLSSGPLRAITNIAPEGFLKIALEPPVSATTVAEASVAGALGKAPAVLDTYDMIVAASKLV
jgi:hypothetical protein